MRSVATSSCLNTKAFVNRTGYGILQIDELGFRAAQSAHEVNKPIDAKHRGHDRKE